MAALRGLLQAPIGQAPPPSASPVPCGAASNSSASPSRHGDISDTDTGLSVTSGHIYLFVLAALFLMAVLGAAAHCLVQRRGGRFAEFLKRCSTGAESQAAGEPDFLQRRVQEHAEQHAASRQQQEPSAPAAAPSMAAAAAAEAALRASPPLVMVFNPGCEVSCAVEEGSGAAVRSATPTRHSHRGPQALSMTTAGSSFPRIASEGGARPVGPGNRAAGAAAAAPAMGGPPHGNEHAA
ncbi:hypothetical protein ABPG75_008635 [Micractinium tetrahymenae]